MTDLNPDDVPPPIAVNASPVQAQLGSGVRFAMVLIAAMPSLMIVLGKHNFIELVNYIASAEFAPVLAILLPIAIGWAQWLVRRVHTEKVVMARKLPDSVAVVK